MKDPGPSSRHRIASLLVAGLVAWAAIALGDAAGTVWLRHREGHFFDWEVQAWTPGAPPQRDLEWFLRSLEPRVPRGSSVLFTSSLDDEPGLSDHALYLYYWAAYLWPDRELRRWGGPETLEEVGFWVAYRKPVRHDRARELADEPLGHLYRVTP